MIPDFLKSYPLEPNRMHEACGSGAAFFALALAAQFDGMLLWIREQWTPETLNPLGFADVFAPDKLLTVAAPNQIDVLACGEESLRSGTVPLVVMELRKPLDLTMGRRLQLAARAGQSTALVIMSEGKGSNAAQTRWRCEPLYDPRDSTLQRWEIIKNKTGTLGVWNVRWSASSRCINVVSQTGQ
jgi:protein ImuA